MKERLKILEEEYSRGQELLLELDHKRAAMRDTLLRISGAIQVLREMNGTDTHAVAVETGD